MRSCLALSMILLVAAAPVGGQSISAKLAAARMPTPSFVELHEQYLHVVVNESGFKSQSDQEGILDALLHGGGGRVEGRRRRGTGYGLDYTRLMSRMVRHSMRTFPRNSRFLRVVDPRKLAHKWSKRTYHNEWTSTIRLDCGQPSGWDVAVSKTWLGYVKRCAALVESTRVVLQGRIETHCDGPITTWGSRDDRSRKGGALDSKWHESTCDRPPQVASDPPQEKCAELRANRWRDGGAANRMLLNSTNCSRNYFFSWLEIEQPKKLAAVIE